MPGKMAILRLLRKNGEILKDLFRWWLARGRPPRRHDVTNQPVKGRSGLPIREKDVSSWLCEAGMGVTAQGLSGA